MPFGGETYDRERDGERLNAQLERVKALMLDGRWRSPQQLEAELGEEWASISARLRDLRKKRFGSYDVRKRNTGGGQWEYRVLPPVKVRPRESQPCSYERHRQFDWRLPKNAPKNMQGPGYWVCGVCHPPPWPEEFELSVGYGAETITIRLERREGAPA